MCRFHSARHCTILCMPGDSHERWVVKSLSKLQISLRLRTDFFPVTPLPAQVKCSKWPVSYICELLSLARTPDAQWCKLHRHMFDLRLARDFKLLV